MNIKVLSKSNKETNEVTLPNEVTSATNQKVISEYINFVRAAARGAIANTKDRSEVSGGGKKPWKQKGTGRARHGSSRSPIWVGGGVTFGPSNVRNFWLNYPKRFKQYARFAILNIMANENKIFVIDSIVDKIEKTKLAEELLRSYDLDGKISIILTEEELSRAIAYRNLPYVALMSRNHQDIVHVASSDAIVFSQAGYAEYFALEETK